MILALFHHIYQVGFHQEIQVICQVQYLAGVLKEAGVVRARTSVLWRQNTVAEFIATRPILRLCKMAERRRGTRVPQQWWEQLGIDWKLTREKGERAAASAEQAVATAEETETPGSGAEAGSEKAPMRGWTTGDTGEEASLGVSGSSGQNGSGRRIETARKDT